MAMAGHSGSAARTGGFANPSASVPTSADVLSLDAYRTDERPTIHDFVRTVGPYDRFFKRILDLVAHVGAGSVRVERAVR
jgi:hypothetical protein